MSLLNISDIINNKEIEIRGFIKDNYTINGTYTIKNGVFNGSKTVIVDVDGSVTVKNKNIKSLTNGLFRWGIIKGHFGCNGCEYLQTLEGAPRECSDFDCSYCINLESLIGGPEICKTFSCTYCNNLNDLQGAPKECNEFYCNSCNNVKRFNHTFNKNMRILNCCYCLELESLIGTPKECRTVYCMYDISIKSIEGIPTKCTHLYRNGCIGLPDKKELLKLFPNIKYIG